jgi:hypothetical protein
MELNVLILQMNATLVKGYHVEELQGLKHACN